MYNQLIEFEQSPHKFNNITMYYSTKDSESFTLGPYVCPFGISNYNGEEEIILSIDGVKDIEFIQKLDAKVDELAEINSFKVNKKFSLHTPKNPDHPPTLKLKIYKGTIIHDDKNVIRDKRYINRFDKVLCDVSVLGLWVNEIEYGISYQVNKIQVF